MEQRTRRTQGRKKLYFWHAALGWVYSIVIAIAVLCVIFFVWLTPIRITGETMAPTLNADEIVLADKLVKYIKTPVRGDMVLFADASGNMCVKRVIALPGETVDIVDGRAYIDGRPLDETGYAVNFMGDLSAMIVPEGTVFVLGDNRAQVYDSRLDSVGCIAYEDVIGVLRFRVAPASRFAIY